MSEESQVSEPELKHMENMLKRALLPKAQLATIVNGPDGETQFYCVMCSHMCTDKKKMELHLYFHNKVYRFLCGICGTGLKRKEHLDRHISAHNDVRPHVCPQCNKTFKRKEHLNIHRTIHSGQKSEVCPICNRSFYRRDHLQKHLHTHNKLFMAHNLQAVNEEEFITNEMTEANVTDDEIDVKPDISDLGLEPEVTMEIDNSNEDNEPKASPSEPNHKTSNNPSRPYECGVCKKTYKRKDHLKIHAMTHLKKEIACSECGEAFENEEQLLYHMNEHLQAYNMEPNTTENSSFSTQDDSAQEGYSTLDNTTDGAENDMVHLEPMRWDPAVSVESGDVVQNNLRVATQERRPHECPICHKRFKRKQHLQAHANVHLKFPYPIWCPMCHEGFPSHEELQNHACPLLYQNTGEIIVDDTKIQNSTPHEAKKENKYPEEHEQAINAPPITISDIPIPQRVYVCKYCLKPFRRKDHYKIHLHIHTGVKSCYCPECGRGFYRKDHLQKHMQTHTKEKTKKTKKQLPDLFPINMLPAKKTADIKPEITIHAPSNANIRVPLKIKVPYQIVVSMDNGEQRTVTVDPQSGSSTGQTNNL